MATFADEATGLLTELARAAAAGNNVKQALARCVAAGASIDEQVATDGREITSSRMPPLLHAAKAGNIGAVKALLAAGAAVTATGASGGATALHVAFECTNKQRVPHVVRVLIDAGASVTARRSNGFTPLHAAAQYDCADGVRLLLAAGANLEARCTQHGAAALAHAAAGATDGKAAALCALLEAGADPTSVDKHGMSALVTAACSNPQEADVASGVVGVLVAAGADVNEERAGRTALDVCLAATRLNRLTNLMPHMYQPAPLSPYMVAALLRAGSATADPADLWRCHSVLALPEVWQYELTRAEAWARRKHLLMLRASLRGPPEERDAVDRAAAQAAAAAADAAERAAELAAALDDVDWWSGEPALGYMDDAEEPDPYDSDGADDFW